MHHKPDALWSRKKDFEKNVNEILTPIPKEELTWVNGNLTGHSGEKRNQSEIITIERFGLEAPRNKSGQMFVDFTLSMEVANLNTMFLKRVNKRVTYKSGERTS